MILDSGILHKYLSIDVFRPLNLTSLG
jgi:hypothetical protein